jgi:hypothetical protein
LRSIRKFEELGSFFARNAISANFKLLKWEIAGGDLS